MAENHSSRTPCTEQERKRLRELAIDEYWSDKEKGLDWYIENLLPQELACAATTKGDDGLPRLQKPANPVDVLAMMVGESLEPLLQLICVLQPRKIVLVLNKTYGEESGKNRWETMQDWIEELSEHLDLGEYRPSLAREDVLGAILEYDTPTAVFRALDRTLREVMRGSNFGGKEAGEPLIMVDITGAKKSMMVGAFLYAAHSGLPMTYVDFDSAEYNVDWGRPYGFACKIREIANPYQAFALRDWERVRQLYLRYDFRGAQKVLTGEENSIIQVMNSHLDEQEHGPPLYDAEDVARVRALSQLLNMYEAWDSGDFPEAYRIAQEMNLVDEEMLPTAIRQFGPNWFQVTAEGISNGPEDFYANQKALRVYAVDELQRVGRLIVFNQDYRSAFLRAGGLNEVVMTARLVAQFLQDEDREKVLTSLQRCRTRSISMLFTILSSDHQTWPMTELFGAKCLRRAGGTALAEWAKQVSLPLRVMPAWWKQPSYSPAGQVFAEDNGWRHFLTVRNSLAHRYVSVSEDLARDAVRFVQANIENFFGANAEALPVHTESLPWRQLTDLLQLDFLPPRLRD